MLLYKIIDFVRFTYFNKLRRDVLEIITFPLMCLYIMYCIQMNVNSINRLTHYNNRLENIIRDLNRKERKVITINKWEDIKMDLKCSSDIKNWHKTTDTCFICLSDYDTRPIFKCNYCKNVICLFCFREWTKTNGSMTKCLSCQNPIIQEDIKFYGLSNGIITTILRENKMIDILNDENYELTIDEKYQLKKNILKSIFPKFLDKIKNKNLNKTELRNIIDVTIETLNLHSIPKKKIDKLNLEIEGKARKDVKKHKEFNTSKKIEENKNYICTQNKKK